ncbi:hypothetical protein CSB85_1797 [Pseudomonas aeruginosa]|nr:hypothetical protein CSB85_1797 [Pseudomonas aeruginosa]RCH03850.1 hypothetical protein CSC36_1882 [Pseudomonas aeruginosa]
MLTLLLRSARRAVQPAAPRWAALKKWPLAMTESRLSEATA